MSGKRRGSGFAWTPDEDELMRAAVVRGEYPSVPGRNDKSVLAHARYLGIELPRKNQSRERCYCYEPLVNGRCPYDCPPEANPKHLEEVDRRCQQNEHYYERQLSDLATLIKERFPAVAREYKDKLYERQRRSGLRGGRNRAHGLNWRGSKKIMIDDPNMALGSAALLALSLVMWPTYVRYVRWKERRRQERVVREYQLEAARETAEKAAVWLKDRRLYRGQR